MSQPPQSSTPAEGGRANYSNNNGSSNGYSYRGRGSGSYQDRGGSGGRGHSTPYQPPTEQQQRFINSRNTLRNALEEVDIDSGRSMMIRQPRVEGQQASRGRGGGSFNQQQQQLQNGIPASHMTPHAASQPQLAQHGASVVRSSVVSVPQGAVHFFSSVQKRGGAFTTSERETYEQLRRSGAISKDRGVRNVGSKYAGNVKTGDIERRFARMEADRAAEDFASASRKRHRFEVSDSESVSDVESDADVSEDAEKEDAEKEDAEQTAKTALEAAPDAQQHSSASDSDEA